MFDNLYKLIHPEGYVFIIIFSIATFILFRFDLNLGWLSLILTVLCIYFFRNPERVTPIVDNVIISPADGIIQSISTESPPEELNLGIEKMQRISIFLSVLNVHVNRIPISGKVIGLKYNPGKFVTATLDKASKENERQSVVIETLNGNKIVLVQIAGLVARRIICDLELEQQVQAGARYGIIKFGSRVDVYLPLNVAILVNAGQTCVGGETQLADLSLTNFLALRFEKR